MWVRLDCTLASHRKILRVGAEAAWLWVCGLAHANQHTTNGVIHRDALVALYPSAEWTPAKRRNLVAKLVEAGLWEVIDADSWMIHGYAEHQSEAMSEAVEARREREREKKRAQRNAGKSGGSQGVSPRDTQGDTAGSPRAASAPVPGVSPPSDRPTVRPTDARETRASAEPTPSAHGPATTPTGRSLLDAFRDAAGSRATLVGNMSEERGLARMLDRLAPSTAEVQAMADALGSPASWWPPGKKAAPKHVTLRDLAGWKGADGSPEWAPLSALIAHIRAEAAARARREAEERAAAEAAARRAPPPEDRPQITPEAQARIDEARRRMKAALWTYGDPPLDGAKQ